MSLFASLITSFNDALIDSLLDNNTIININTFQFMNGDTFQFMNGDTFDFN